MKEIEVLYNLISDSVKAKEILANVASHISDSEVIDTYFSRPDLTGLNPDENGRLLASFRLRRKGDKNYVTYKNDHFSPQGTWIYSDEFETLIEDYAIFEHILLNLGFQILVIVDNKKSIYENEKYEIVIEDVKDLGYFLEIENKSEFNGETHQDIEAKKAEMRDYLVSLGIEVGEEMNAGKPELLLSSRNK